MKEDYQFAGFSSDIALFAEVERRWIRVFEGILDDCSGKQSWVMVESMRKGADDEVEARYRRFALQPDEVGVWYRNPTKQKGVRVLLQDPLGKHGSELSDWYGLPFTERPALLTAFMDIFGDPKLGDDDDWYSRDLVVTCEFTTRTEALVKDLVRCYIVEDLGYEEMALKVRKLTEQEWQTRQQRKAQLQ